MRPPFVPPTPITPPPPKIRHTRGILYQARRAAGILYK
jgi:hypothetical protein